MRVLYDEDLVAWAEQTAQLLRERCFEEIDVENLAEELEAMGSWRSTLRTQRAEIQRLLDQSTSRKGQLDWAELDGHVKVLGQPPG